LSWRTAAASAFLVAGAGLELLATLGLCALRDAYDRLHCVALAGLGAPLIAIAIVFRESFSLIGDKALLVGAMLLLSGPVLVHATLRSLLIRERGDWRDVAEDGEGGDAGTGLWMERGER